MMDRYMRQPVEVTAVQWFPPGEARHRALETGVRHPDTDPLADSECPHDDCTEHDHGPQDGEIGELGGKFWIRTSNASATYLQPGQWIVRSPKYPFLEVLSDYLFWQVYSGPI